MGPSFMNQKSVHIERKQQTAEHDRFKKALKKIVLQKGIASPALGGDKPTAGISNKVNFIIWLVLIVISEPLRKKKLDIYRLFETLINRTSK